MIETDGLSEKERGGLHDPEFAALIEHFIEASRAEQRGEYCQCLEPSYEGPLNYLCATCHLHNKARKEVIVAHIEATDRSEMGQRAVQLLRAGGLQP